MSEPVDLLAEDAVVHHFEQAARGLRTGSFAQSAAEFELLLAQPSLSHARRVLALAGVFTAWHLAGEQEPERAAARRFFRPMDLGLAEAQDSLPTAAARELRWLRHVALRVVAATDAEERRSVAASALNPIPILAPSEAGETLGWVGCGRDRKGRYLIESESEHTVRGVRYSVLAARCDEGRGRRKFWFDLSLWYAFTATHLGGANPPIGFSAEDAARDVTEEFGRSGG